jgi:hypothetical protein
MAASDTARLDVVLRCQLHAIVVDIASRYSGCQVDCYCHGTTSALSLEIERVLPPHGTTTALSLEIERVLPPHGTTSALSLEIERVLPPHGTTTALSLEIERVLPIDGRLQQFSTTRGARGNEIDDYMCRTIEQR